MWSPIDDFFTKVKTNKYPVGDISSFKVLVMSIVFSIGIVLITIFYFRDDSCSPSERHSLHSVESFSPCYENLEDIDNDAPSEQQQQQQQQDSPSEKCLEIQNSEQCTENETARVLNLNDVSDQGPNFRASSKADTNEELPNQSEDLQSLKQILEGVIIPSRRLNATSCPIGIASKKLELNLKRHDIKVYPDGIYMDDLKRFYKSSKGDLKKAATRLVQTSIFRGERFPIDLASCQAELQKNQCFSQGRDMDSNPVMYFRVKCPGPWGKTINSISSATLYQMEMMLKNEIVCSHNYSSRKITLVVWTGMPLTNTERQNIQKSDYSNETKKKKEIKYYNHCDLSVAKHLIKIFLTHYPERLSRALIMPSFEIGLDAIFINMSLPVLVPSSRVRRKVIIMKKSDELKKFIDEDQLIDICGGKAPVIHYFGKKFQKNC